MAYQRLRSPLERAEAWSRALAGPAPGGALGELVVEADRLFHEAMDDDFNSAKAIGHLFDLSRAVNRAIDDGLGAEARAAARELLRLGGILGLFWKAPTGESWPAGRARAGRPPGGRRKARDWAASDAIRKQSERPRGPGRGHCPGSEAEEEVGSVRSGRRVGARRRPGRESPERGDVVLESSRPRRFTPALRAQQVLDPRAFRGLASRCAPGVRRREKRGGITPYPTATVRTATPNDRALSHRPACRPFLDSGRKGSHASIHHESLVDLHPGADPRPGLIVLQPAHTATPLPRAVGSWAPATRSGWRRAASQQRRSGLPPSGREVRGAVDCQGRPSVGTTACVPRVTVAWRTAL